MSPPGALPRVAHWSSASPEPIPHRDPRLLRALCPCVLNNRSSSSRPDRSATLTSLPPAPVRWGENVIRTIAFRRPHPRPPGHGPPVGCWLERSPHRPAPRLPRVDGAPTRQDIPGRPPAPRAPAVGDGGSPLGGGGAAVRWDGRVPLRSWSPGWSGSTGFASTPTILERFAEEPGSVRDCGGEDVLDRPPGAAAPGHRRRPGAS